jgi:regulator of sigma E protease
MNIAHEFKNQTVDLMIDRSGNRDTVQVQLDSNAHIGVGMAMVPDLIDFKHTEYSFLESWPAGIGQASSSLQMTVKQLPLMFSAKTQGWKSMGGFIRMGDLFAPKWDWRSFWWMTAFISIMLAFMNVLPIPALDGGHVVFLLYEMITGRKPAEKFLEYAQVAGFFFLITLLLYVNGNDIYQLIFN